MMGTALKPWNFANNTETADGVKVNQNFDVAFAVLNELVAAWNASGGSTTSLYTRLGVSLNDDGSIKPSALPVGTYDPRGRRIIAAASDMTDTDATILVDTTAGTVTFTLLPSAETLIPLTIINIGLTGYSAIVTPALGDLIMGLETYELSVGGESVRLTPDGVTGWWRSG